MGHRGQTVIDVPRDGFLGTKTRDAAASGSILRFS
jgi:hypothetical protein